MDRRVLHTPRDVEVWCAFLKKATLPMVVAWKQGDDRSTQQNNISHKWYAEAAMQLGDRLPHQIRAYCKLHHGVPIRREDEDFRDKYDGILRPLQYEQKLALMIEPFNLPVTSEMTVKQMTQYLDAVYNDLTAQGVKLTVPENA